MTNKTTPSSTTSAEGATDAKIVKQPMRFRGNHGFTEFGIDHPLVLKLEEAGRTGNANLIMAAVDELEDCAAKQDVIRGAAAAATASANSDQPQPAADATNTTAAPESTTEAKPGFPWKKAAMWAGGALATIGVGYGAFVIVSKRRAAREASAMMAAPSVTITSVPNTLEIKESIEA